VHPHILCKRKIVFWMRLIASNNLTALNRIFSFFPTFDISTFKLLYLTLISVLIAVNGFK